ncbi:DUF6303 family protein [Streptomyces sp. NPDC056049]|uniref:DUF6303 family protein n=1 Tax=Streptomyces sp. NPDC056049 TaxID=3345693 RepID=UPI0035E1F3E2
MSGAEVVLAAVRWADPEGGDGGWTLHLVTGDWELSPTRCRWPEAAGPPDLMSRYDALASLGYAVAEGGPGAWRWQETLDEDGRTFLFAYASVRPLTPADVTAG